MPIALPHLPYELDALEPIISVATLKEHHGAHHRGYVKRLNTLIKGTEFEDSALGAIVKSSARFASASPTSAAIFNNAAQAWNHAFYWNSMRPAGHGGVPPRALAARIAVDFGDDCALADAIKSAASGVFGSGWAWLILERGALRIVTTANADTPIARDQAPLLAIDLWEHAYYLDHRSRRASHVAGVVDQLINWEFAERNFLCATGAGIANQGGPGHVTD